MMSSKSATLQGSNGGGVGEKDYFTIEDLRVLDLMDNPVYIGDMKKGQKKWYFVNKAGTVAMNQTFEHFVNSDLNGQSQGTDDFQNELWATVQCAEQRMERLKTSYPNGKPMTALQINTPIRLKIPNEETPRVLVMKELKLLKDTDRLETAVAAEMNLQSETIALSFDAESQALEHANQKARTFYARKHHDVPLPEGVQLKSMKDMFSYTLWRDDEQKQSLMKRIRELTLDSKRIQLECEMAMPGMKDTIWHMFYFIPALNPVNGRLMVVVNQHDVTRQHLQSEQLMATKAQEQFVSAVSHELRTPLNGIIGLSDSLLHSPDCTARIAKMVEQVKSSGLRLAEMVDDIIDAASVTRGDVTLHPEMVDLRQIGDNVATSGQGWCRRGVELRSEIGENVPCVNCDRERVTQVLRKLVHNACKFTAKGSITISARSQDQEIVVEVADTGAGIPRDKWERIWYPFTQLDMSSTRNHGGAGLGLTLVKKLVEAHGGRVGLKSRWVGESTGTTFFFTLPTRRRPTRLQPLSPVSLAPLSPVDVSGAGREAEAEAEAEAEGFRQQTREMERLQRKVAQLEADVRRKHEDLARAEQKRTNPHAETSSASHGLVAASASPSVRSQAIAHAVNQHLLMCVELQGEELQQREAMHLQQHANSASFTRALLNDIQALAPLSSSLGSSPFLGGLGANVDSRPSGPIEVGREVARELEGEGSGPARWGQRSEIRPLGAAVAQLVPRPR